MSHRFYHNGRWHLVDEHGIRIVSASAVLAICDAQPLDFNTASMHYRITGSKWLSTLFAFCSFICNIL